MATTDALLVMFVTLLAAAFFSGSETAVISCSKVRLRHRAERGSWTARLLERLIASPELFFSVVLVGTNLAVIACTAAATSLFVSRFGDPGAAVATVVVTPLLLVFGEVIPKSAFLYHADRVSTVVAPMLRLMSYVLWPVVFPAMLFARLVLIITRAPQRRFNLLQSREELVHLYRRGKGESRDGSREQQIIGRVFRFGETRVGDLMVPFERVVSFTVTASVADVVEEANRHSYSRFPITSPDDGKVVGIVSHFDLLGLDGGENLAAVMHEPHFAGTGESAEKLFVRMKKEALHMAVVTGEDGAPLGILTLENILESIVGDIDNEFA